MERARRTHFSADVAHCCRSRQAGKYLAVSAPVSRNHVLPAQDTVIFPAATPALSCGKQAINQICSELFRLLR